MSLDTDIAKLQEQIELLKKQKEEKKKNNIDLTEYLNNFESLKQIDDEVSRLCKGIIRYRDIFKYANVIDINADENLLDPNVIDVFDKIKEHVKNYPDTKKNINRYNRHLSGLMFKIDQNDQSSVLFEKILKIAGFGKTTEVQNDVCNIYTCYRINNLGHLGGFENKYKNMFDNPNSGQIDMNKIMEELDNDLDIIKIFYFDSIAFIKSNQKLLSEYPDNFEKITQLKIIELNKKKITLI